MITVDPWWNFERRWIIFDDGLGHGSLVSVRECVSVVASHQDVFGETGYIGCQIRG